MNSRLEVHDVPLRTLQRTFSNAFLGSTQVDIVHF
jgi:hypothetical protein